MEQDKQRIVPALKDAGMPELTAPAEQVDVRWLEDALHTKKKWQARAVDILAAMHVQEIETVADICVLDKSIWAMILVDDKVLPGIVQALISSKARVMQNPVPPPLGGGAIDQAAANTSTRPENRRDETHQILDTLLQHIEFPNGFDAFQLQSILDLPFNTMVPSCIKPLNSCEDLCFEYSDKHYCPQLESALRLAVGGTTIPTDQHATEMDWSGHWDAFYIATFLRMAISNHVLQNVVTYRNGEESSSTKGKDKRDFNLLGNNVLLVAGEDKSKQTADKKAKQELLDKTTSCAALYGPLKYFFAYTTAGPIFEFFAIVLPNSTDHEQNVRVEHLQRSYNVTIPAQRVALFRALINVCRWVRSVMSKNLLDTYAISSSCAQLRTSPYDGNLTTSIINKGLYIQKKILLPDDKIAIFENVYTALQEIRSNNHCKLEDLKVSKTAAAKGTSRLGFLGRQFVQNNLRTDNGIWVTLHLTPIGARKTPSGEEEVCECFTAILQFLVEFHAKGFLHRDLRWPNILCDQDKYWFVIDFEMAGAIGDQPWWSNADEDISAGVPCTVQTDLYQVGVLLQSTGKFVSVSSKLKHKSYLNAAQALAELQSLANPLWERFKAQKL